MKKRVMTRRNFLVGAGKVALTLPLLEFFDWKNALAATLSPDKNLIYLFTPNCSQLRKSWVKLGNASGSPVEIPTSGNYALQPLSPYKDYLTCVDNIAAPYMFNHPGTAAMIAGTFPVGGAINDHDGDYSPTKPSFTYALSPYLKKTSPYPVISLGFRPEGETVLYKDIHAPVFCETDPAAEIAKYFQGGSEPSPKELAERSRKKSSVDFVLNELKSLQSKLGTSDRARLEHYVDSLRDVETQLQSNLSCANPGVTLESNWTIPKIFKTQIDILVAAMACGQTHVGNLIVGRAGHNDKYDFLQNYHDFGNATVNNEVNAKLANSGMHDMTHGVIDLSDTNGKALFVISKWYMSQIKYMVDRLVAYGIFDRTTIVHFPELGFGGHNLDDRAEMQVTLIEGGNTFKKGYFFIPSVNHNDPCIPSTGDVKKCPTDKQYLASVYTTVAHGLGANVTIGEPDQLPTVLSQLIA